MHGTVSNSDGEVAAVFMQELSLEQWTDDDTRGISTHVGSDNSPTVGWYERMSTRASHAAPATLVKWQALRQRFTRRGPTLFFPPSSVRVHQFDSYYSHRPTATARHSAVAKQTPPSSLFTKRGIIASRCSDHQLGESKKRREGGRRPPYVLWRTSFRPSYIHGKTGMCNTISTRGHPNWKFPRAQWLRAKHPITADHRSPSLCSPGGRFTISRFRFEANRFPQSTFGRGCQPETKWLRSRHDQKAGTLV